MDDIAISRVQSLVESPRVYPSRVFGLPSHLFISLTEKMDKEFRLQSYIYIGNCWTREPEAANWHVNVDPL